MLKHLIIICGLIALSSCAQNFLKPCAPGNGPAPTSVVILNCADSDDECPLSRGRPFLADFEFTALSNITQLTPKVSVTLDRQKTESDLPNDRQNACDWLLDDAQQCPLPKGKNTKWRLNLPLSNLVPLVGLKAEVILYSQDGVAQMCTELYARIYAA